MIDDSIVSLTGLPVPSPGHLTIYLLGPGYGESQVLILPDGRCLVVDSCQYQGQNLSRALLDYLGVSRIDLLVLTHPDFDHFAGIPELLTAFEIHRLWRFREAARITELAAFWLRTEAKDERLHKLYEGLEALATLEETTDASEASYGFMPWRGQDYEVRCVAPSQHDLTRLSRRLRDIVEGGPHDPGLSKRVRDFLLGERDSLAEPANPLSLALIVRWRENRVLLSGDLVNGDGTSKSGWRGALTGR